MTTFQEAFDEAEASVGTWDEALEDGPVYDTVDDGQVEVEGDVSEAEGEAEAEPSYFDLEQYGDQLVKIKVDGVEQLVPVKDLPNGYMRNEKFTQNSQALAAERARLQAAETLASAYERNPVETVKFLAQQQGITLAQAQAQAEDATAEHEGTWANEGYDPRVEALEARIAEFDARDARAELDRTLAHLESVYGEDFNATEVVARAIELETTDLAGVYKQIAFDRIHARQSASAEVSSKAAAEDAKVVQAKSQLAGTVASAQSFKGAGSVGSAPITTVAAALEAALAEHDFNF